MLSSYLVHVCYTTPLNGTGLISDLTPSLKTLQRKVFPLYADHQEGQANSISPY